MINMSSAYSIGAILAYMVPSNEAFIAAAMSGRLPLLQRNLAHSVRSSKGEAWSPRKAGVIRRRSAELRASDEDVESLFGESDNDGPEGGQAKPAGWEGDDIEETEDAPAFTKDFYSEVASRWNTTVEGAIEVEKDLQFDKALYDELRTRRDFGFEQDLGLELEKRNISKEADVTKIVDEGLEALPGVSSTSTFVPTSDLTPREVVTTVLEALKKNDQPHHNHGVEVFIRFLSPSSAMHGVEMEGVARYLAENRNRAFMHWDAIAYPRPLTLSGGKKKNKAFQPLKLKDTMTGSWHPVSVYLTLDAKTNCWLIESIIVKGDL